MSVEREAQEKGLEHFSKHTCTYSLQYMLNQFLSYVRRIHVYILQRICYHIKSLYNMFPVAKSIVDAWTSISTFNLPRVHSSSREMIVYTQNVHTHAHTYIYDENRKQPLYTIYFHLHLFRFSHAIISYMSFHEGKQLFDVYSIWIA